MKIEDLILKDVYEFSWIAYFSHYDFCILEGYAEEKARRYAHLKRVEFLSEYVTK